jgi:hypothetical protein
MRKTGCTLSEIQKVVLRSRSIIFSYIKNIIPYKKYSDILEKKQNGNKFKSEKHWKTAKIFAKEKVKKLSDRDLMIIAAMLYWGEGRKEGELAIINSDVCLMKVFLKGLLKMGIPKNRIKISIRLFSDLDRKKSINFWLSELNLKKDNLISVNYLERKKEGKLPYGMCRLRVEKGSLYFKQLISMIDFVKKLP